jgi:hypothetical protein
MEMDQKDECGGRCPGCRSIYNKDRILETSTSNQMHVFYDFVSNMHAIVLIKSPIVFPFCSYYIP